MFQVWWLFNWFRCWPDQFYWCLKKATGRPPSILTFFWLIWLVWILNNSSSVFWTLYLSFFMPSQYPVKNYSRFVVISTTLTMRIDVGLSWCMLDALRHILNILLCCDIHKDSIFQIWLYKNEGSNLTKNTIVCCDIHKTMSIFRGKDYIENCMRYNWIGFSTFELVEVCCDIHKASLRD